MNNHSAHKVWQVVCVGFITQTVVVVAVLLFMDTPQRSNTYWAIFALLLLIGAAIAGYLARRSGSTRT